MGAGEVEVLGLELAFVVGVDFVDGFFGFRVAVELECDFASFRVGFDDGEVALFVKGEAFVGLGPLPHA